MNKGEVAEMTTKEAELSRLFSSYANGAIFITFTYKRKEVSAIYQGFYWSDGRLIINTFITDSSGQSCAARYIANLMRNLEIHPLKKD